ncbi:hypothetical protein AAVH_04794 [Aphelenchoides avenae]|nr:hypothetical protein AAVH_04794 [Aphelenchus avenae]
MLLLFCTTVTNADCGCGARCLKYTSDLQCTRCCTATVRRSVSYPPPEADDAIPSSVQETNGIVLDAPVARPYYYVLQRAKTEGTQQGERREFFDELSRIIANLALSEREAKSRHRQQALRRARQRLQDLGRVRYADLYRARFPDTTTPSGSMTRRKKFSSGERDMYDLLERTIRRLRYDLKSNETPSTSNCSRRCLPASESFCFGCTSLLTYGYRC